VDNNGNMTTCISMVTVVDDGDPSAECNDITVQLDTNGMVTVTVGMINNGSNDACDPEPVLSVSEGTGTFGCSNVGGNNSLTLKVQDANENVATCSAVVTVEDKLPPIAVCQNITIQLNATGEASVDPANIGINSTDNCEIVSYTASPTNFDCSHVGANNITLTVTDVNDNEDACSATVTVEDNEQPVPMCTNVSVELNDAGVATISGADVGGESSDACEIGSLVVSPSKFDCTQLGNNTVTLTVTDVNSNTATCDATVTVMDNEPPAAICFKSLDVTLNSSTKMASISVDDVDNGTSNNCGSVNVTIDKTDFDCTNVGEEVTVTLTATDVNDTVMTKAPARRWSQSLIQTIPLQCAFQSSL